MAKVNSFLKDLWRLTKPYWFSDEKVQARALLDGLGGGVHDDLAPLGRLDGLGGLRDRLGAHASAIPFWMPGRAASLSDQRARFFNSGSSALRCA